MRRTCRSRADSAKKAVNLQKHDILKEDISRDTKLKDKWPIGCLLDLPQWVRPSGPVPHRACLGGRQTVAYSRPLGAVARMVEAAVEEEEEEE